MPRTNLISNIGFGEGAHHTSGAENPLANMATRGIPFPLSQPDSVERDEQADTHSARLFGSGRLAPLGQEGPHRAGGQVGLDPASDLVPDDWQPDGLGLRRPSLGPTTLRRHSTSSAREPAPPGCGRERERR